jgi:NADH-quinone oxidoreductase subunit N
MGFSLPQFIAATPEIFLLSMLCITLLAGLFFSDRYHLITYWLVQGTLVSVFFLTLLQYSTYAEPFIIFNGGYVVDRLAVIAKLFIYLVSFFAFAYAREYIED